MSYASEQADNNGVGEPVERASAARIASETLRLRLDQAVWNFGTKYRIPDHEAPHLLMNTGVRL